MQGVEAGGGGAVSGRARHAHTTPCLHACQASRPSHQQAHLRPALPQPQVAPAHPLDDMAQLLAGANKRAGEQRGERREAGRGRGEAELAGEVGVHHQGLSPAGQRHQQAGVPQVAEGGGAAAAARRLDDAYSVAAEGEGGRQLARVALLARVLQQVHRARPVDGADQLR